MSREALLAALIVAAAPGIYDSIKQRSSQSVKKSSSEKGVERAEARERRSPHNKSRDSTL